MSQNYRSLYEFNPEIIYLNHAATGLLPKRSAEAMTEYIEALAAAGEPSIDGILAMRAEFRNHASKLLNVDPDEIVFIRNTTDGLSFALHSIDWQANDNMVVQEDAFPASLYLAAYCFPKIEKRYIPLQNGSNFYERLNQIIDKNTRAVVVDLVSFHSGYRMDMHKLSEIKQNKNFFLIVDGIQALGAVQVDLKNTAVDFFSAGGVKWLNAPAGTGIQYVRQEILEELIPFHVGWAGAEYENLNSMYPVRPLYEDARRFQPANDNYIGMNGLIESLKLIQEITPQLIEAEIMRTTDNVISTLNENDFEVLTPANRSLRAGIVSFKHRGIDNEKMMEKFRENNIICSLREGYIRWAFHYHNTEEDFEKAFSVTKSMIN